MTRRLEFITDHVAMSVFKVNTGGINGELFYFIDESEKAAFGLHSRQDGVTLSNLQTH